MKNNRSLVTIYASASDEPSQPNPKNNQYMQSDNFRNANDPYLASKVNASKMAPIDANKYSSGMSDEIF